MLIKKIALIPFALSALFISTTNIALADEEYLTIDQILSQAESYDKEVGSGSREIRKPKENGMKQLTRISSRGGLIKKTSFGDDKVQFDSDKPKPKTNSDGTVSGEEESDGVDDIPLVKFNASRIKDFNGTIVGYQNGVPIMCPNPDPLDIHPDVNYNDGPNPTISVPIKFRNFDITLTAFNKTMIEDVNIHQKNFIVSYPYEADAYNDRDEVIALHNEIKAKRAFGYRNIESMKDVLTIEEIKTVDEQVDRVEKISSYDMGYSYIIQIIEVDDNNKRIKFRVDYKQRNPVSKFTERFDISDNEFRNIEFPVIEEKSIARTFWLPIKNREEVTVKVDNADYIKVKFNKFEYDAFRVEIDDLEKIAVINEDKRLLDLKNKEAEKQAVKDEKLKYFDEIENAIRKL